MAGIGYGFKYHKFIYLDMTFQKMLNQYQHLMYMISNHLLKIILIKRRDRHLLIAEIK